MSDYTLPPFPVDAIGDACAQDFAVIDDYGKQCAEAARAPLLARIAEIEADAKRLAWIEKRAKQNTANDRYGNGGHWSIGFFSDDSRMNFRDAIDAAMKESGDA